MADNLNINIRAKLDKQASQQQIRTDISQLENTPFFIRLIGKLHKALTKANVETDIKQLEKSVGSVRLNGRLNRSTTRQNIRSDIQNVVRGNTVTLDARIDEQALETSVENARNTVEQNFNSNPINVPINADTNMNNCTDDMRAFNNVTRETRGILADYLNIRDIFREISNAIKKAIDNVEKLNKAETDLMIATQKSASEMKSLMSDYNQMAKDMSSTTIDVTGAADDYLRQGHSVADTNTLIRDSLILSKIGQIESAEATQYLTSSMKGYQVEAENVIDIVDKLSAVDLQSASNASGLAESMSHTANIARTVGVEMDELIAYIAVAKEVTQDSASSIGNAYRSIFSRLSNIRIGKFLDEDGNDISGEINDAERVLSHFGLSLRNSAMEFKDTSQIIAEVAAIWDDMSSVEQAAIRKAFGNTYQAEKVVALFENYNKVLELTEVSANSSGTALDKFAIYEQSLEASTNRLTASLEGLAYNTISADFIKGLADGATAIVSFVDNTKLLKTGITAGIFTGLISGVMALGTRMVALRNNVVQFTQAMNISRQTSALNATQFQTLRASVVGLTEAQLRLVLSSNNLTEAQRLELMQSAGIEQARQRQLLQTWNLTTATQAQTTATFSLRGAWEILKTSIISNPIGLLVGALTLATTVTSSLIQKQKELRESIAETAQEAKEQTDNLNDLIKTYEEFADKTSYTAEEKERLAEIQQQLVDTYHFEAEGIDLVNGKYDEEIAKLKELQKEKLAESKASFIAERTYAKNDADTVSGKTYNKKIKISEEDFQLDDDKAISDEEIAQYEEITQKIKQLTDKTDGTGVFYTDIFSGKLKFEGTAKQRVKDIKAVMGVLEDYGYANTTLYAELNTVLQDTSKLVDAYDEATLNLADNMFQTYTLDNPLSQVGQDSYLAWRNGLLESANGDTELQAVLSGLAKKQFPDYAEYFDNLAEARQMFVKANSASDAKLATEKDLFLSNLSPEDLEIATQIPDLFADGLDGAAKKIEEFKKDNPIETEVKITISQRIETETGKIKLLTTAMEDMNETGYLSSETYADILAVGDDFLQFLKIQDGRLKLDADAMKKYAIQELETAKATNNLALAQLNLKAASLAQGDYNAHRAEIEAIGEEIQALMDENALFTTLQDEYKKASFSGSDNGDSDNEDPESVTTFKKALAEKEHLLAMEQITEEEFYTWLDSESERVYGNLADYQNELWKHEEDIYKWRKDKRQEEIDSEKEYIESLKDEYSEMIDSRIDEQKKLAESIEKSYDDKISAIDKEIDAINKVSEAEERHKDILDAEKSVMEAQKKLQEASIKNRLTYVGNGAWEARQDTDAIEEAKAELEDAKNERDKAYQENHISALEEQKELLETQKDNASEYYDNVVKDLEQQKTDREKTYDTLVNIYDEISGEKKQTTSNTDLVKKLTDSGDISKAVQGLTPTELTNAVKSGILTTDSNGNYTVDYSVLDNNTSSVAENTTALNNINDTLNKFVPETETANDKLTAGGFNLVADENGKLTKRPTYVNGKAVEGQKVDAVTKTEWDSKKNFGGYGSINNLVKAIQSGEFKYSSAVASQMFNNNVQSRIGQGLTKMPDTSFVNNVAPVVNQTFNIDGDATENTVNRMKTAARDIATEEINSYFQYLNNTMQSTFVKSRYGK